MQADVAGSRVELLMIDVLRATRVIDGAASQLDWIPEITEQRIMQRKPAHRIAPATLKDDEEACHAVTMFEDYAPHNALHAPSSMRDLHAAMKDAQREEQRVMNLLKAARSAATDAEWAFHQAVVGVKAEVLAQYGPDSNQIVAVGLKRRSARKRPTGRPRVIKAE